MERVPGIGRYTAGAIASIAQGEQAAVVDGNVERVYSRLVRDDSTGSRLNRNAWNWAESQVGPSRPGDWNQALMELGATVCVPAVPRCDSCPLASSCEAYQEGDVSKYPVKPARIQTVQLKHEVWVPWTGERFGIRQIPNGEWWQGMWEFPRADAGQAQELQGIVGGCQLRKIGDFRHAVTHHRIQVGVHLAIAEQKSETLTWRSVEDLASVPMPSPQRRALGMAIKEIDRQVRQPALLPLDLA